MKPRKWVYLLTGLMYPSKCVYPDTELTLSESIEEINLEKIGIRLKRVFLTEKERIREVPLQYESKSRFIFYINDGIRNDNFAQTLVDAVMSALALVYDVAREEIPTAIPIAEDKIRKGRFIRVKDIVGSNGVASELYFEVMGATGVGEDVLNKVWCIVPAIVENMPLMNATSFYRESIMQAWVTNPDVSPIMWTKPFIPSSIAERARIETAYQNAFKAIEAIIGEPPKDERKLRVKLIQSGINPDEKVGYEMYGEKPGKETILKKIVNMQHIRDKKAAHAKTTTPRGISYCELKDKQELARYTILSHIDMINKSLN